MVSQSKLFFQKYWIIATILSILPIISSCQNIAMQSKDSKKAMITSLYKQYAKKFPQVIGIEAKDLKRLMQQGEEIVLVDVRSPMEMAVSMIPGAISKEEFEQNIKQYQNKMIVAYCTIGYRSGKYAHSSQSKGIKIINLEGSLLAWSHVQGKLVNSLGETQQVHVFNRQWQLTAANYKAVW